MNSFKNNLNGMDWKQWLHETFIFSLPAIMAVLVALQNGLDWRIALGAGYSALITSVINLYGKYKAGVTAPDVPVTPVIPTATTDTTQVAS